MTNMTKTRTVSFNDGRREIVRVLSAADLEAWTQSDPLAYEKSIVWLEDVTGLPFVREIRIRCATSRRGCLRLENGDRVVGYSKLMTDAPRDPSTQRYVRRLFYLKRSDARPAPRLPANAVDPNSILPGVAGRLLARPRAS